MFVEYDELDSPNTYAIVDGTMSKRNSWRGNATTHLLNATTYSFKAYWIVRKGATKGGLAYGTLSIEFNHNYAQELNNRDDYKNLSVEQVLGYAADLPYRETVQRSRVKPKTVKSNASAIFGQGNVWSSGVSDETFKNLVDAWFNLPQLPDGVSRKIKLVKN